MRRTPALIPVSAFALALVLASAGCSTGPSATQIADDMWAAVSTPAASAGSLPAGDKWAGGPAVGMRLAVPGRWVTVGSAALPKVLHDVNLGKLGSPGLAALVPGLRRPGSLDLADPGPATGGAAPSRFLANISLYCAPAHFPPGTNPVTGLSTIAEKEFAAVNPNSAQIGQTTVDGRPALLVYDEVSVASRTVTGLQYAIAAPAGRVCYVTLVTQQPTQYEPVFARLRPGIRVLP